MTRHYIMANLAIAVAITTVKRFYAEEHACMHAIILLSHTVASNSAVIELTCSSYHAWYNA